jgi:hypothetical protein
MKPTNDISRMIRQLRVPASPELDERIHAEIAKAQPNPASGKSFVCL